MLRDVGSRGVKRTSQFKDGRSPFDPNRTSAGFEVNQRRPIHADQWWWGWNLYGTR
jgi:hypothetical protein